jgi:hypothetical protein
MTPEPDTLQTGFFGVWFTLLNRRAHARGAEWLCRSPQEWLLFVATRPGRLLVGEWRLSIPNGDQVIMTTLPPKVLTAVGRVFFGLPMVAFGVVHVLNSDFVTKFAPGWPSWVPGRPIGARVVGAILIAAGLSIVFEKRTRITALSVATIIALSLVFLYVPKVATRFILREERTFVEVVDNTFGLPATRAEGTP